jgi:hypothetical protein
MLLSRFALTALPPGVAGGVTSTERGGGGRGDRGEDAPSSIVLLDTGEIGDDAPEASPPSVDAF